jgi:hypothetical protein
MSMRRGAVRGHSRGGATLSRGYWGQSCDGKVERGASVVMRRGGGRESVNDKNFGSGRQTTNCHNAGIRAGKGMCNPQTTGHL